MRKVLRVAQREYVETTKTKTFLLSLVVTPVFIAAFAYFAGRAAQHRPKPRPVSTIAVTDLSKALKADIQAVFDEHNASHPNHKLHLRHVPVGRKGLETTAGRQKDEVRRGTLQAYVVIDADVLKGRGKMRLYTRSTKASNFEVPWTVQNLLNRAIVWRRCELRNVRPELLKELQRHVPAEQVDVGRTGGKERALDSRERMFGLMMPFFFMFMIFMGIFGMGQQMLTSTIEEKGSRVMEVLLSALSPRELLAGKIAGLVGISLTVIALWTGAGYAAVRWTGRSIDVSAEAIFYFAIYYLLGFVLLTSIFAGVGSVCNTLKEAQGLMMPISLIFVIPMMAWYFIARQPDGVLARALSFIPPLTPMVMVLRLAASPDMSRLEVLASMVLLAAAVPLFVMAGAKVFRTGILMYGKRPGLREILRWLGQK